MHNNISNYQSFKEIKNNAPRAQWLLKTALADTRTSESRVEKTMTVLVWKLDE